MHLLKKCIETEVCSTTWQCWARKSRADRKKEVSSDWWLLSWSFSMRVICSFRMIIRGPRRFCNRYRKYGYQMNKTNNSNKLKLISKRSCVHSYSLVFLWYTESYLLSIHHGAIAFCNGGNENPWRHLCGKSGAERGETYRQLRTRCNLFA